MSKSLDSRIEEWIASLPGMAWFDSRNSGDIVGYLHKALWVCGFGASAHPFGVDAWLGGLVYLACYVPLKIRGVVQHYAKWKRGESKLGPVHDEREHKRGVHVGFAVDAVLDILTASATVLALRVAQW